jgi:phenylacetic acid degradation operon negative regulatory protein
VASTPRHLILSVFALYARERDNWLSVSSVIAMLEALDVDAAATRSSISRLKKRGVLEPERRHDSAGYRLSATTLAALADGDLRIWRPAPDGDPEWLIVMFSVPESERDKRHALRSHLTRLGFGNAAAGVWVAPAELYDETLAVLDRAGLAAYTEFFRGDYLGVGSEVSRVAEWWDLDEIGSAYAEFVRDFAEVEATDPAEAFAAYVPMLTEWRRLPYLDPGLPASVLPADWPGGAAERLFTELDARLRDDAMEHAASVISRHRADSGNTGGAWER